MLKSPPNSGVKPSMSAISNSRPMLVTTTPPGGSPDTTPRVMNLASGEIRPRFPFAPMQCSEMEKCEAYLI